MTWIPVFNDVGTHLYEYYVVCIRYAVRTILDNLSRVISRAHEIVCRGKVISHAHDTLIHQWARDIPCAFMRYYFVRTKKKIVFQKNMHVYTTVSKDRVQNFILSNWIKEIFETSSQSKYSSVPKVKIIFKMSLLFQTTIYQKFILRTFLIQFW